MRHLELTEYQTERGVDLTADERDGLREIPDVTVEPTRGMSGSYDITPGSTIGAAEIGSLAVRIRPKIDIDRVLFLMSYTLDPSTWRESGFDFGEREALVEAVIPGFVRQVSHAFRRGILQGYRTREEALSTVRGRLRIDDQIRRRHGLAPPIEVRYDEFTEDIEANRLIKAALHRLSLMRIRAAHLRSQLRSLDRALGTVASVRYDPRRLPDINWTRSNEHYRPAVELAKLILRSTSIENHDGRVRSSAFLVDMNSVFEDFVVVALREALGVSKRVFPQGSENRRLRLDHARTITLEPDISWWDAGVCRFVGDVKYKRIGVRGIKHPDLYQLLSYAIAADLPAGLLIYAAGEADEVSHEIVNVGRRLEVTTIDVGGSPDAILGQIRVVAERVRAQRPF